ncbi:P-loop NTPase [Candidatus Woesearchaeota archaeon]|nr:P-loop NTPase [Candidatus Woesearchaeota archaeon]
MTRFIAIVSGKGGVGKTTTAINLATALVNAGNDSIVLDGNLTTPNIGLYLGFPNPPVSLHEVIDGKHPVTNATYLHASGLRVIPGSLSLDALKNLDLNKIKKTFNKLKGYSESIIIDTGAGLTKENQAIMNMADEIIVVTNPEVAAVTDTLKTIKKAEEQNKTILGVVLNKLHPTRNEMSVENVGTMLSLPIIGMIPRSDAVKQAQTIKHPVVYSYPDSEAAIEFKKLAEKLK